ncbi:MAG: hypothetical protein J5851_02830, partial [Oscillospiraceae bacterium]|nr:hypothetical protein [Oscillospiraceae bacterium]
MKLWKRLAAAGIAGCMLLMGTIPEAALAAQDFTIAPLSTSLEIAENNEHFRFIKPKSMYAEPGQLISLPFKIYNLKENKRIKEVEYKKNWTTELTLVHESFIPEMEYDKYTCQLNFWFKVDKKAPIIEPNEEFRLEITKIILEDGEEVPAEDLPAEAMSVCFRLQEPSDPLEPVTRIKLSPGESKDVWFDITADKDQLISTIVSGGWAVDMSDPLAGIDWDAWDGKSTVIDGKQHLRLRVQLRAKKNLTPGIVYEKELNMRSHARDENGKSGKDLGREIVSNPKFELIIGDPLPPTEPAETTPPVTAPTQKPTQRATDPTETDMVSPTVAPQTETAQKPTQAVTDPTEPTQKATQKPTQAVTDPTEPTQKPTQKPTQAVTDPTEPPTQKATEAVTDATQKPTQPSADPIAELTDPTETAASRYTTSVPKNITVGLNQTKTVDVTFTSKDGTGITAIGSGLKGANDYEIVYSEVLGDGTATCKLPVMITSRGGTGKFTDTFTVQVRGADGIAEVLKVPISFAIAEEAETVAPTTEASTEAKERVSLTLPKLPAL